MARKSKGKKITEPWQVAMPANPKGIEIDWPTLYCSCDMQDEDYGLISGKVRVQEISGEWYEGEFKAYDCGHYLDVLNVEGIEFDGPWEHIKEEINELVIKWFNYFETCHSLRSK